MAGPSPQPIDRALHRGLSKSRLVVAENPRRRGTFIVIDGRQRLLTVAGLFLPACRNYGAKPRFSGLSVLIDFNGVFYRINTGSVPLSSRVTLVRSGRC